MPAAQRQASTKITTYKVSQFIKKINGGNHGREKERNYERLKRT